MKVPFYKQETSWTCGAAAMRMALGALNIKKSENELVKILKTNKVRGTYIKSFKILASKLDLKYVEMTNASFKDIKSLLKKNHVIIINYYFPRDKLDHYAVVKSISKERIFLLDPWYGISHSYNLTYFKRIWKSDPRWEDIKCWIIGLKR